MENGRILKTLALKYVLTPGLMVNASGTFSLHVSCNRRMQEMEDSRVPVRVSSLKGSF